jgi:hypothetical protein
VASLLTLTDEQFDFLYFFFCEIEDVIADVISVGCTYLNILHLPSKKVCNSSRLSLISGISTFMSPNSWSMVESLH